MSIPVEGALVGHEISASKSLRDALDHGPWTKFQKSAATLAVLAVILDGFDIQLMGVAIPALMKEWNLPREAFVPVLGVGLIAMCIGTVIAGWLADRLGRKVTLLGCMLLFGAGTLLAVWAHGIGLLMASRIIASLGLGGAMPSAVALLSEFTPVRRRSFMVTFGMISTPMGGVLAGLVGAWLLPTLGWTSLFLVGGLLPLALALAIAIGLPESPQFTATRPDADKALAPIARRLGLKADAVLAASFVTVERAAKVGYAALLAPWDRVVTLLLWVQFLSVLTAAYTVFNWLPVMAVSTGFTMAMGGTMLATFNFGGIAGAFLGALAIDRIGSRWLTIGYAVGGALACLILLGSFGVAEPRSLLLGKVFLGGLFIAGLQPMLFAVAANAYPTQLRSTGVGAALAVGRLGAIASSLIGSLLIGAGTSAFFAFLFVMMVIVTCALAVMRRHVPGQGRGNQGV